MSEDLPEGLKSRMRRLGLIAGSGRFPLLVLEQARRLGIAVTVVAIREETLAEIEERASPVSPEISVHWISLGQLGRLIRIFKAEGVDKALMAGQVRHVRIFNRDESERRPKLHVIPDLTMISLLIKLRGQNTSAILSAFVRLLAKEGIELIDSTTLLTDAVADKGVLTRRSPRKTEWADLKFGRSVALEIARLDIGQTVVVKDQAVVAVEAMEGTDETIRRASQLVAGKRLSVIKVGRPNQDMRFDVPIIGLNTIEVLKECNVSVLALDAGKTLILDRPETLALADRYGICIVAQD